MLCCCLVTSWETFRRTVRNLLRIQRKFIFGDMKNQLSPQDIFITDLFDLLGQVISSQLTMKQQLQSSFSKGCKTSP
jgi:hypothetical protein